MGLYEYYLNVFPYQWVIRFLTCNGKYPLNKRQIRLRIKEYWQENKQFDTISDARYYMNFSGYAENEEISKDKKIPFRFGHEKGFKSLLLQNIPASINAGPIFGDLCYSPMTLDVDLKDYGKKCCETSCDICWVQFARPALIDLYEFLINFMLFKSVLFVDSGSGGFHVYILDERVWVWDQEARNQFCRYLPKSVIVDKAIRDDFKHMVKIPFSPNFKNGCLSLPILDIYTYLPSMRIKTDDADVGIISTFLINFQF